MTVSNAEDSRRALAERARDAFARVFSGRPDGVFFAPGRVNLLGAHLDYNGGDVLPVAVDRGLCAAVRLRPAAEGARLRLTSVDREGRVELDGARLLESPSERATIREGFAGADLGWAAYAAGVWREFAGETGQRVGIDVAFAGDLPIASGLSSSAAIEVVLGTALDDLLATALGPRRIAELAHRAETEFVGVPCGIMDQFASALAGGGRALLLHCDTRAHEFLPLPQDAVEIVVVDTLKPRELAAEGGFEARVRECRRALDVLRRVGEPREWLASYHPDEVESAADALGPLLHRRARHVTTEMQRVRDGVAALRAGDLEAFGARVFASHRSTRDDYEVSCAELDAIVDLAQREDLLAGARLTGAGFGGCVVGIARPGGVPAAREALTADFRQRFGRAPTFLALRPGPRPGRVEIG